MVLYRYDFFVHIIVLCVKIRKKKVRLKNLFRQVCFQKNKKNEYLEIIEKKNSPKEHLVMWDDNLKEKLCQVFFIHLYFLIKNLATFIFLMYSGFNLLFFWNKFLVLEEGKWQRILLSWSLLQR